MDINVVRKLRLASVGVFLTVPMFVWADSGVGVDTWRANKLDPTGGQATEGIDPDGTSWLEPGQHRTPTGNLYGEPTEEIHPENLSVWQIYGTFDVGYLNTTGSKAALYDRYTRWPTNGPAFDADLNAERPSDGSYAAVRASRISAEDQYYQAVYGKAGAYKAEIFVRDMPNVLSTDSKSIWNGVGSNNLSLKEGLVPAGSTPAQVAAVSAAAPVITLGTERNKQGLSLSAYLTPHWSVYLNASDEERKGDRPYGGPFFFDFDNLGGAILETIKPIDDNTVNITAGARYAGSVWRFDFGYSGSIYRDAYLSYSFQQPFTLGPSIVPGTQTSPLTQGQMSMEPNNEYNNLHATATHLLPMNGEASLTAGVGEMNQNDNLIPPTNCTGTFGFSSNGTFNIGPQNPQLFPCSQWNTTVALSQQTANMLIVTTLTQATIVLQPTSDVSVRGGAKYYREDYRNQYVNFNPQNGSYGYVAENGGQASIVPGDPGFWNPVTYPNATDVQYESIPYSWQIIEGYGGADWKLSKHDTVGLTYTFDHYSPAHREVSYVDDNTIKLNWTDKSLKWLTFRFNYTYLKQSGSVYNSDPYAFAFFYNLPGFVPADDTPTAWTVNAMRKYDISDRTENKVDLMATVMPRPDMTVTASFRGDWNQYPTVIGRQGYDTTAAMVQWEWQPEVRTNVSLWGAIDHSSMHMANVNDAGAPLADDTPNDALGGPTYPLANRWWAADEERNWSGGAALSHYFRAVRLDLNWNYLSSRGITSYNYASPTALTFPYTPAEAGNQFPAMTYVVNSLTGSVTVPLNDRASLRFYDYYEHGQISDWHYAGFNNTLVYGNRVYTDAGPQGYNTNVVGLFVNVKL
jgi:Putative outer membrane beta-barrel porin, MtrB/PioB